MEDNISNPSLLNPFARALPIQEKLTKRLYTIPELMRLTGMSRKQVQYWDQIGLVAPTFRDQHANVGQPAAFYSATEAVKALIVCELRRAKFSPRQVQQVAKNLQAHGIQLYEAESYLLTDGYSVYYAFNGSEVVDILKHHRQMLLLVPIHEQVAKVMEAA